MHLCGIKYEKGAASFFTDALNKNIDENSIYIKKDGTTFQKLQVLPQFKELIGKNVRVTRGYKYLLLSFDYALRTNKEILALTLIDRINSDVIPQSLLNLHSMKKFKKKKKVIKIEFKSR